MALLARFPVLPIFAAAVLSAIPGTAIRAAAAGSESAPIAPVVPLPAVPIWASGHGVALGQFADPADTTASRTGDTVTFLVSLRERNDVRQWLVQFQIADPTDAERKRKPPLDLFIQLNGGEKLWFSNSHRLALDIQTTGPFSSAHPGDVPATKPARTMISPDLLGLGLDQSCRASIKWFRNFTGAAPKEKPPAPSLEEQRVLIGFFPALMAFFEGVEKTPGLRDILWDIVEKPSVWSIVRRGGRVDGGFEFKETPTLVDLGSERLGTAAEVFRMPLKMALNDQPALRCALIVTAPKPPLLTCAGIIGIEADPPEESAKHLSIRLIASRRADADGR
jgi:hypothetical protein